MLVFGSPAERFGLWPKCLGNGSHTALFVSLSWNGANGEYVDEDLVDGGDWSGEGDFFDWGGRGFEDVGFVGNLRCLTMQVSLRVN